jgi:hypothetical protein
MTDSAAAVGADTNGQSKQAVESSTKTTNASLKTRMRTSIVWIELPRKLPSPKPPGFFDVKNAFHLR